MSVGGYLRLINTAWSLSGARFFQGTTEEVVIPILEEYSGKNAGRDFGICANPEYLRERCAEEDFSNPWIVVIGELDKRSGDLLQEVYHWVDCPIYRIPIKEAEMQKFVHNLFNANKISFFNEMRLVCQQLGLDCEKIFPLVAQSAEAIWNPLYGTRDLGPFGGSCLPKDTIAFLSWAKKRGMEIPLVDAVLKVNEALEKRLEPALAKSPVVNLKWARPVDDYLPLLAFYFPLGVIGFWRWGTWLVRRLLSLFYKPSKRNFHASVSIVTPVYNEDPDVFRQALASWRANNPLEIIAVIDYTDEKCIREFEEFSRQFKQAKLIVTEKPGKRPALADGIRATKGKIIALVDSDAFWSRSVLREALRPFADPKVGGVAVRQNVLNPQTLAQNIFDIQLDLRFFDEIMGLNVAGNVLTCFSGRTAFYRRKALMPVVDDMVNETFWGKQCIGGDDKRLTYLIEAAGWKGRYQHSAHVYTPGAAKPIYTFQTANPLVKKHLASRPAGSLAGLGLETPLSSFCLG